MWLHWLYHSFLVKILLSQGHYLHNKVHRLRSNDFFPSAILLLTMADASCRADVPTATLIPLSDNSGGSFYVPGWIRRRCPPAKCPAAITFLFSIHLMEIRKQNFANSSHTLTSCFSAVLPSSPLFFLTSSSTFSFFSTPGKSKKISLVDPISRPLLVQFFRLPPPFFVTPVPPWKPVNFPLLLIKFLDQV